MQININTGFGIIKRNNVIIDRFELKPGLHNFADDIQIQELPDRNSMLSVEIYKEPIPQDKQIEIDIANKMNEILREQAIVQLKQEGKIPSDYDSKIKGEIK
jgi:hypothetical protein